MSESRSLVASWWLITARLILLVVVLAVLAIGYKALVDGLPSLSEPEFQRNAVIGITVCFPAVILCSLLMTLFEALDRRSRRSSGPLR